MFQELTNLSLISNILQILGLQPGISKVFLDHQNHFLQQVRAIMETKQHLRAQFRIHLGIELLLLPIFFRCMRFSHMRLLFSTEVCLCHKSPLFKIPKIIFLMLNNKVRFLTFRINESKVSALIKLLTKKKRNVF